MSKKKTNEHKGTEAFEQAIKSKLDEIAKEDHLFAEKYNNPKKNIAECIRYIFKAVQSSGRMGFADEEVYSMAIHYYDEEDIKVPKGASGRVVVNHTIELTEEEKKALKEKAKKEVLEQEKNRIRSGNRPAKVTPIKETPQQSLF